MSSIPVTFTSRCYFHFERSNISFNESKLDGMAFNSDGLNYSVRNSPRIECENFYGFLQTGWECEKNIMEVSNV